MFVCFEKWIYYKYRVAWLFPFRILNKFGHPSPVPPFLVGCESQHGGHRAAAEYPPGKGASWARAGEAAEPWGLFWGHKKEAGGSRGEQGTFRPTADWPRSLRGHLGVTVASLRLCYGRGPARPPLAYVWSNCFPFCTHLWNSRGLETSSPKGKEDLLQQLQVERRFDERFSFLFSSDLLTDLGRIIYIYIDRL